MGSPVVKIRGTREKMHSEEEEEEEDRLLVLPPSPKCRKSLRLENKESYYSNNSQSFHMEENKRLNTSNLSNTRKSSREQSDDDTGSSSEEDVQDIHHLRNRSKTISPERKIYLEKSQPKINLESSKTGQNTSYFYLFILIIIIVISILILPLNTNEVHKHSSKRQSINNPTLLLAESIKNIKAIFHNQELYIWNDISSAINEVISRTPKTPSIILLFAKETATMDCLATELARASSTILHADNYLVFNPEDFGNDTGEIITILNKHSPEKKKVVMIRDILNINAEAIKALHNLCDRINPLIAEAIYILTMQTSNYQSPQKKLNFVENHIYNKLSKSIDQDILMALVTRITDGAIISVQPESRLKYC